MNIIKPRYKDKITNIYLDLVNEDLLINDPHYKKTFNFWGKNLHKNNKNNPRGSKTKFAPGDKLETHIKKVFNEFSFDLNIKNYLEIGCGQGIDLRFVIQRYKFKNIEVQDARDGLFNKVSK